MIRKVGLITGSAKRIGRSIALHLAEKGFDLALHYHHSSEEAQYLKAELSQNFPEGNYRLFQSDLADINEVESLIPNVISAFGRLDLLVNNASVFKPGTIKDTSDDLFIQHLNINFRAPFMLTRDYGTHGELGAIINVLDTRIASNVFNHAIYSLTKKMLSELTLMSALELAPGIRVNAIAPGAVLAPEGKSDDYLDNLIGNTPLKKNIGMETLLMSIDYILNNQNLTGQILFCDNGEQLL